MKCASEIYCRPPATDLPQPCNLKVLVKASSKSFPRLMLKQHSNNLLRFQKVPVLQKEEGEFGSDQVDAYRAGELFHCLSLRKWCGLN